MADAVGGRRVGARGGSGVVWHLPEGPFTHAQFDLADADLDHRPGG
ncbi:MAG: hypothetical protein HOY78_40905 [Saccharothrix sp.]|nr:hypothetical protein [Saccharothrix sp.]